MVLILKESNVVSANQKYAALALRDVPNSRLQKNNIASGSNIETISNLELKRRNKFLCAVFSLCYEKSLVCVMCMCSLQFVLCASHLKLFLYFV